MLGCYVGTKPRLIGSKVIGDFCRAFGMAQSRVKEQAGGIGGVDRRLNGIREPVVRQMVYCIDGKKIFALPQPRPQIEQIKGLKIIASAHSLAIDEESE